MAKSFEVKTRLTAEDDASAVVGKVDQSFAGLTKTVAAYSVEALAGVASTTALIALFKSAVDASSAEEESINRLNSALRLSGPAAQSFNDALESLAATTEQTTRFSADATRSAEALIATYGVTADQIGLATQAAIDLSARLGVDLNTAAQQVAGSFNGFNRGLDRIVPGLKSLSDAGFSGAENITRLNEAFGGGAVDQLNTYAGAIDHLGNAWDIYKAREANWFTQNTVVLGALKGLADLFVQLNRISDAARSSDEKAAAAKEQLNRVTEDQIRVVSSLAQITDRATRINSEHATAMSEAQKIAHEYGLTLQSEVATAEEKRRADMERLNDLLGQTGDSLAANKEQTDKNTGAIDDNTASLAGNVIQQQQLQASLAVTAQQVVFTAQAFEYLARTQGRAVATEAAVAAGGRTILGGTRVLLPGGGSRLTSEAGFGKFGG